MCSARKHVDRNKLGALLSGKMLQTFECTSPDLIKDRGTKIFW